MNAIAIQADQKQLRVRDAKAALREFSSFLCDPESLLRKERFAFSRFAAGIPKGALTELCGSAGSGKTEAVLRFLAENACERVAWLEEDFSVNPAAFSEHGVSLGRILFVDLGFDGAGCGSGEGPHPLSVALQVIASQAFGVVVLGPGPEIDQPRALRRLQLAAEKSNVAVLLLAEEPMREAGWAITTRLEVRRPTSGAIEVRAGELA